MLQWDSSGTSETTKAPTPVTGRCGSSGSRSARGPRFLLRWSPKSLVRVRSRVLRRAGAWCYLRRSAGVGVGVGSAVHWYCGSAGSNGATRRHVYCCPPYV